MGTETLAEAVGKVTQDLGRRHDERLDADLRDARR